MKELVGNVVLLNRVTGAFDAASVFQDLDSKNLDDFERIWKPALVIHKTQDAHWDWVEKAKETTRSLKYETFAIECDGITQGLMLVDVTKFAKVESQKGRELAYVELLATAPWNRPKFNPQPLYKGVGRVLIGSVISLSADLGFRGRIGLHSLPDSESWYRSEAGFTDVGYDPAKRMRYFEMTEAQATAFISS